MPVSVEPMAGYPRYSGGRDSLTATQQYKIAWSDIDALYLELFPPAVGNSPSLPALLPGSSYLYADSVEFVPFVGDQDVPDCTGGSQSYSHALATVQYKTIPYEKDDENEDGQIITRRWDASGEFLTMPNGSLVWVTTGKPLPPDLVAGKIIPMVDFTVTLHRVPEAYFNTLRAKTFELIGHVNFDVFEGAAPGTLLFLGGSFTQEIAINGDRSYNCDLKFQYKSIATDNPLVPAGWNHFMNPADGRWGLVWTKDDHIAVYSSADFTELYS